MAEVYDFTREVDELSAFYKSGILPKQDKYEKRERRKILMKRLGIKWYQFWRFHEISNLPGGYLLPPPKKRFNEFTDEMKGDKK